MRRTELLFVVLVLGLIALHAFKTSKQKTSAMEAESLEMSEQVLDSVLAIH